MKTLKPLESSSAETMSGAKMIIQCLKEMGVTTIFGYPGGAILPLYDELYTSGIHHVNTRHEQAAIHAAEGYAKATGKAGTVMSTSGPGATNLVTGIADAYMDSVPLVVITGQVATGVIGTDAFQEVDVIGITAPITKYSFQPKSVEELPFIFQRAYELATTGRPGPVVIDLPKDITMNSSAFSKCMAKPQNQENRKFDFDKLIEVSKVIKNAKRPLLYIGGGIIHAEASEELRHFVRKTEIPVTSTLMGLGCFPADDPLFLGMLGMHGAYAANMAISNCDLLIACGVRFDDRVTGNLEKFSPNSIKVHIDIDSAEISKNIAVDYGVNMCIKDALSFLQNEKIEVDCSSWTNQVQIWKEECPLSYQQDMTGGIKPQYVIDCLSKLTNGEAIVTTEVGQHQMWAAHFYQAKQPRSFLTSGGLGTMGFGFPAAIGAQLAKPDAKVVCIAGDASLQMNIQEFQTIVDLGVPIKVFVINNGFIGMVRQWQEMFYENRSAQSKVSSPDFVRVAEAYGIKGIKVDQPTNVYDAIVKALQHNGPVVVDFKVEEVENVFPMVPPGKANSEMVVKG